MELRVAATPGCTLPPGCFVGVRLGDVLKQGRYEPQRCYHFPSIDRRRNAKIDIYRHVGSCVLAVDPEEGKSEQEVSVLPSDPTIPALKLNVNMNSAKVPSGVDLGQRQREEKQRVVTSQAKDYLTKFAIEEKLSLAVKALLKEQPEDPIEFITRHLKESKLTGPSKPKNGSTTATTSGAAAGKPTGQTVLSEGEFAPYYKANGLPSVATSCYDAIYSKFPAAAGRMGPQRPTPSEADNSAASKGLIDLRQKARDTLEAASKDGRLEDALKDTGTAAKDNFLARPSVGTWCSYASPRTRTNVSMQPEQPERSPCILRTSAMIGPSFYSLGLPNMPRVF